MFSERTNEVGADSRALTHCWLQLWLGNTSKIKHYRIFHQIPLYQHCNNIGGVTTGVLKKNITQYFWETIISILETKTSSVKRNISTAGTVDEFRELHRFTVTPHLKPEQDNIYMWHHNITTPNTISHFKV